MVEGTKELSRATYQGVNPIHEAPSLTHHKDSDHGTSPASRLVYGMEANYFSCCYQLYSEQGKKKKSQSEEEAHAKMKAKQRQKEQKTADVLNTRHLDSWYLWMPCHLK